MSRVRHAVDVTGPVIAAALLFLVAAGGCESLPWTAFVPSNAALDVMLRMELSEQQVQPIEKPSVDAAKVRLGQALFFDKTLSGNRNISCATCHHPMLATADGLSLSLGVGGSGLGPARSVPTAADNSPIFIPRHAPDVFNRAGMSTMFWDGRVTQHDDGSFLTPAGTALLPGLDSALAAQAMFPVTSRDEMRGQPGENELAGIADDEFAAIWAGLMMRLLAIGEYADLFAAAFPGAASTDLTFAHAANAIAAFEIDHWTLTDSPFDNYLRGDDSALSEEQKWGGVLFYGSVGCAHCHAGTLMTDQAFHNMGAPQLGPGKGDGDGTADFGRERVSGDPADRYCFRTPPLRNVAATGPWMHDGVFTTLEDVVRHHLDAANSATDYDGSQLDPLLQPLVRTEQATAIVETIDPHAPSAELRDEDVAAIVAFLHALTSPGVMDLARNDIPDSVPSGLPLGD